MNNEWMKEWQDEIMVHAKEILMKEGHVSPVMFIVTKLENIPDNHPFLKTVPRAEDEIKEDHVPIDNDRAVMLVPLNFGHMDLLSIMARMDPRLGNAIRECAVMGKDMQVENMEKHIFNSLCRLLNWTEKDVVAEGIVQILRSVKADAFLKLDEIWHLRMEGKDVNRKDHPQNLENCEDAVEAVSSILECDDFRRMVSRPFKRTVRNTGAVETFLEKENEEFYEDLTKTPGETSTYGRFVGLLQLSKTVPFKKKTG
jgi:hypothetical protein